MKSVTHYSSKTLLFKHDLDQKRSLLVRQFTWIDHRMGSSPWNPIFLIMFHSRSIINSTIVMKYTYNTHVSIQYNSVVLKGCSLNWCIICMFYAGYLRYLYWIYNCTLFVLRNLSLIDFKYLILLPWSLVSWQSVTAPLGKILSVIRLM